MKFGTRLFYIDYNLHQSLSNLLPGNSTSACSEFVGHLTHSHPMTPFDAPGKQAF